MKIEAVTTERIEVNDDIFKDVLKNLPDTIHEKTIIVISSKIISLCEGNVVLKTDIEKDELIKRESEMFLERSFVQGGYLMHTYKNNMIMPSAGIDASNTGDYYALLPADSYATARQIHTWVCEKYGLSDLGIIITDSRSTLLRGGVVGYSLAYYGFNPFYNYRGGNDLYNRRMNVSQSNYPDSLAAAAVLVMGEGTESIPIAMITDVPRIEFGTEYTRNDFELHPDQDMYMPFYKGAPWKKNQ